jgi:hypothetical protein
MADYARGLDTMIGTLSQFNELVNFHCIGNDGEVEKIFDVYYLHLKFENMDDLYITAYGLPIIQNIMPDNFLADKEWFKINSLRLSGSGNTYKVRTKEINGRWRDVVIKYNRMGQDVPGAEESEELMYAEFNSPFEEFALVMELRNARYESQGMVLTQKPLAIYVPARRIELWKTGRKEYKMQSKLEDHKDVELDMFRSYVVIYEWIKGTDSAFAQKEGVIDKEEMMALTVGAEREMNKIGFLVKDRKPHHIIIRQKSDGVIDYELLGRTPEREEKVKSVKRFSYLQKQKDRFVVRDQRQFPPNLKCVNIFSVDYIYGHAESTNGILWVLGKDPDLFDYFLPERWENSPRTKLSAHHEIYHTLTKDNIHLVWKVSKVGTVPNMDPFIKEERKILEFGYNSPFEEVSFAIELKSKGIRTVYPRAIYMFGKETTISDSIFDTSRYMSHRNYFTPDGTPILRKKHNYIIIWGYWNGPDERLAEKDGDYLEGINALSAYREGIITREDYIALLIRKEKRLAKVGFEDLHLRGSHVLLSLDSSGKLLRDDEGVPEMRICNFELLKKFQQSHPRSGYA